MHSASSSTSTATSRSATHTSSTSHPFTIIKTSVQGCIDGHAGHALDYIAVGDPTCSGGGCLPETAPCDDTLPCCDGLSCQNGTCQVVDLCAGVVCSLPAGADPQCNFTRCDSTTGQCTLFLLEDDCTTVQGCSGVCFRDGPVNSYLPNPDC